MKYADKLKDPRWQKKRLKILERDNFKCQSCGDSENTLHVHHFSYKKNPWDSEDYELVTVCETCHEIWHKIFDELGKYYDSSHMSLVVQLFNKMEVISVNEHCKARGVDPYFIELNLPLIK